MGSKVSERPEASEPTSRSVSTISAVVITLNEEGRIESCLERLRWAHEIVVVDAGSSDRTVELASRYTPRVFQHPWSGFGPQKNEAMRRATGEWVLIVDADEWVTPELRDEILALAASSPGAAAYDIPRKNYLAGRWVRGGGGFPDRQLRLLRRGRGSYNDVPVHENLIVDGPVGSLTHPLEHRRDRTIGDHFRKTVAYAALSASGGVAPPGWGGLVFRPLATIGKLWIVKRGFLDGTRGMILAVMGGLATFTKYVTRWEAANRGAS